MGESLADKLASGILALKQELKDNPIKNVKDALAFIAFVVKFVENAQLKGEIQKADKKEVAVELINRFVDIPYIPEFMEGRVISVGIDLLIEGFNQLFGKNWVVKGN